MYGARPVPPQSGSGWSVLRHFDAFPKQREEAKEFFQSTIAGGVITLVAAALMTLLFMSELGEEGGDECDGDGDPPCCSQHIGPGSL